MATLAQERLDFLKKPSTREFQKWLAEYKPSGAPSPLDAFRNLGGEDPLGGMQPPDTPFVPAQEGDLNVPSAEIEMDSQLNLPSDTDSPDTDSPDANSGTSDTDASGGGLNAPVTTESNDSSADTTSTSGDE